MQAGVPIFAIPPVLAMRLLLLVLVLASSAHAQSVDAHLADLRLATSVRLALVRDASTRALDVDVTAQSGDVRLSPSPASAVRVAQGVAGVRSVNGSAASGRLEPGLPAETRPVAETRAVVDAPPDVPRVSVPAEVPRASAWGAAPRPDTPAEAAGPAVHVVGRGDTLFSLARRYGVPVEALRQLNGLTGSAGIEIGQRLRLR